ncbi:MAG: aminopeptidase N [Oligoflexia bacterium]|nr:aminopeptidase N [Oligoflexia bacterium]
MKESPMQPKLVHLSDYQPPAYLIPNVSLRFEIADKLAHVAAELSVCRQVSTPKGAELELVGEKIELVSVKLNGKVLSAGKDYTLSDDILRVRGLADKDLVSIETRFDPEANISGLGLYRSGKLLCTQMEAEGFRRVTYFADRPDVMSVYTTTIVADPVRYPVLLSNGNCLEQKVLPDGRQQVTFKDPYPKPCYLFALVAGNLEKLSKTMTTKSGRRVSLEIYCEPGNISRCTFLLDSLEKALLWDEKKYGLEYDLDSYKVVAANDFNFASMENKGLNISNASVVLANPECATDRDYDAIERVMAHEAFHNYTGNRVTLRDWFQITLKEGLTVFREQQFCGDQSSHAVERLVTVRSLREHQFPEDRGPNAHPIQPQSYIQIDNFYTTTIYDKGAEVIRMMETLVGEKLFNTAVREYLRRFDGQAVTTEHFVRTIEEVSGRDLKLFRRWYSQAGTPHVRISAKYDKATSRLNLEFRQHTAPTARQPEKLPLHIPIRFALLDQQGQAIPLQFAGETVPVGDERVVELCAESLNVTCLNVPERHVPSFLRNFSAPVVVEYQYTDQELAFLLSHDSDPVNRFEAGHHLGVRAMRRMLEEESAGRASSSPEIVNSAFRAVLTDERADAAFKALTIAPPSLLVFTQSYEQPDFTLAPLVRRRFVQSLVAANRGILEETYEMLAAKLHGPYKFAPLDVGLRSLKNTILSLLLVSPTADMLKRAIKQYRTAHNMTDVAGALGALCLTESSERDEVLKHFFDRWRHDPVVLTAGIAPQCASPYRDVLADIRCLERHPDIDMKNPDKIRAVYGAFTRNLGQFHVASGAGYEFIGEKVLEIDRFNQHCSGDLVTAFADYPRLDAARQARMRKVLEKIISQAGISKGVYEIVSNTLSVTK